MSWNVWPLLIIPLFPLELSAAPALPPPAPEAFYEEDFEGGVGIEWHYDTHSADHADTFTAFSGRFANTTQSLTIEIPAGPRCLELDLYLIDSWESSPAHGGPDMITVNINGQQAFSHAMDRQCCTMGYADYVPPEGTCTYDYYGFNDVYTDGIFHLAFPFIHNEGDVYAQFTGSGLQGLDDESWGLDNVVIRDATFYPDLDGDGFGNSAPLGAVALCEPADGYVLNNEDCDDDAGTTYPGAIELEDGADNDCDALADEGTDAGDDDGDGFSENQGDCDDENDQIYPGASEQPNDADDDCDNAIDEGLTPTPTDTPTPTPTRAPTPTMAATPTPTRAPTPTMAPTPTPTRAPTPTMAATPTPTRAPTPTMAPTPTRAPTPTMAPTTSEALTPSASPTPTLADTPTAQSTDAPSSTQAPTASLEPTLTPSATATDASTPTATTTATEAPTATQPPTSTQPATAGPTTADMTPTAPMDGGGCGCNASPPEAPATGLALLMLLGFMRRRP